jgi:hypothetical protein
MMLILKKNELIAKLTLYLYQRGQWHAAFPLKNRDPSACVDVCFLEACFQFIDREFCSALFKNMYCNASFLKSVVLFTHLSNTCI